nr:PIN domain-containing protein [Desulfofarcimen acetoxidans]
MRAFRSSRPKSKEHKYHSEKAIELIEDLIEKRIPRYISCHTIKELLQYPYISEQEEARIDTMLPQFIKILPTTMKVAKVAGYFSRQSAEYREHHIEDCYIAAAAVTYNLSLYTRNPDDYKYVEHANLKVTVPYQYQPSVSRD